jgi:2',3'-cyclic-nucleotide 2'-phosphodiesterase (5'-nucleotidase family)
LVNIGKLIIKPDGTIENSNIAVVPQPSDTTGAKKVTRGKVETWVNTEISTFISQLWGQYADELNKKIGKIDYDLIIRPEDKTDSHYIYCRTRECSLGSLIADSFRGAVLSDVALLNGGSVRTNLLKGEITRKDIIDVLPFFNSVFTKEIDGLALLDALEFGVSKLPSASGGFPQVSGITFDVDISIPTTVVTDKDGLFQKVSGKRRVSNVKINGEDLILDKKYNLSCSEFVSEGGDGYSMFRQFNVVNESIFTDSDAFSHYIKYNLDGNVPDYYKNENTRIRIIDSSSSDSTKNIGQHLKINRKLPLLLLLFAFL